MTLHPIGDRILVIPDAPRETTETGLVLIQDRYTPDVSGVVVAVGPRCRGDVAMGQHIAFPPHVGQLVPFEGTTYLVMRESEVTASLETA